MCWTGFKLVVYVVPSSLAVVYQNTARVLNLLNNLKRLIFALSDPVINTLKSVYRD